MSCRRQKDGGIEIIVNVYDLHDSNSYLYSIGTGFYHTGVQIEGFEYCFSAHGVVRTRPRDAGLGKFRESILMGKFPGSMRVVKEILVQMRKGVFAPGEYHILRLNCNHFSDKLVNSLLGSNIPLWINRLAEMGSTLSLDQFGDIFGKDNAAQTTEELESINNQNQSFDGTSSSSKLVSQSIFSSTDSVDLFSTSMSSMFRVLCFAPSADMVCDDESFVKQPSRVNIPSQRQDFLKEDGNAPSTQER